MRVISLDIRSNKDYLLQIQLKKKGVILLDRLIKYYFLLKLTLNITLDLFI